MKKIELTVAPLICGLLLFALSTPSALATDYTYVFTANPGQVTWYNGTTIEISSTYDPYYAPYDQICSLVSMHMVAEIDMAAWAGGYGYGPVPASLTPSSMTLPFLSSGYRGGLEENAIAYANPSGWAYEFDGGWGGAIPFDCPELEFVLESSSVAIYIYAAGLDPGGFIQNPASGTWAYVPDTGSSLELLATSMASLGAVRLLPRGRKT